MGPTPNAARGTADRLRPGRLPVVVMGVSGSGKTTIGTRLAHALDLPFVEGDELHPRENIAKMSRGEPLTDEDRAPWLAAVGRVLTDSERYPSGVVVACSALRKAYRDRLRTRAPGVRFVFLDAPRTVIEPRVAARSHHFMPPSLLASQFATLERPGTEETDVVTVDATAQAPRAVETAAAALEA
jgi:gluconokinase